MNQVLEPQFEGEVMKMPEGTPVLESTPTRRSHLSVWLVVLLLLATVLGGGGFFMWSQWEALIAPIIVPSPIPSSPTLTPATSTPGVPDFTPPPSTSTEVMDIITDLDNTLLDPIDTDLDTLDQTVYEVTGTRAE